MAARKRDSLAAAPSSESQMTYTRFMELFPDHDTCLDYLKDRFHPDGSECPKCGKTTKFHRIKSRAAYGCQWCGYQVYPTAGTIFHKSTVNLQMWFWAIFLMSSTRCGISAKQLEREIGVSYPTAHRMFKLIRTLLSQDGDPVLTGEVEMDETYVGGKRRNTPAGRPLADSHKTPVFGMVERKRGQISATVVPNVRHSTILPHIERRVLPSAMVYTDEYQIYDRLPKAGYEHRRVHHAAKIYVDGDVHTNTIEGFFGLLKNGIRGVYHSVSRRYLQSYLDEYAFRYNHRGDNMFSAFLGQVEKTT
jgi:transposase-like protein